MIQSINPTNKGYNLPKRALTEYSVKIKSNNENNNFDKILKKLLTK